MSLMMHDDTPEFMKFQDTMAIGIVMEQNKYGKGLTGLCSEDITKKDYIDCMGQQLAETMIDNLNNTR